MANNQIKIGIGFQVDKTGLNELQNSLRQIQISANQSTGTNKMTQSLKEAASTAKIVDEALEKAFNVNLGTTNLSKFNQELKKNNLTIEQVRTKFSQAGQAGQKAWNLLGSQILKTNIQLKTSNKLLDEMATSMANTVKWGITASIFNTITQSISKAYTYTKKLDGSLNDIRIVTDKSAESMEKFAKQANEAAKGLGASTLDYTEASLIYYQQGLSDAEVQARTETTIKAANVTGQHANEVSEQLTAVWNGYKVSAQEAELYIDKLAAVATATAADLEELSTGMSKVASAANAMGVDIDQLNAQLATIVSVTRQAPESVGTALKTIYARMSDLKLGGTDEDGLGLGDVSGTMESMGIDVLDASGNLREMGDVIKDVAAKWNTWTEAQKTAMAQVMAGKRQYNNLVALFENWDMYTNALNESANAAGTLQKQQDIYMESTDAHLQKLRTTAEGLYDGLFDAEEVNVLIDLLTDLTQVGSNFVNSFGGGFKSIGGILMIVANIFNKQLSNGISNLIVNQQKMVNNAELLRQKAEQLKAVSQNQVNLHTLEGVKAAAIAEGYQKQAEYAQKLQDIQHNLNQEEYNRLNTLTAEVGELTEQITLLEEAARFSATGLTKKNQDKVEKVLSGEESFEDEIGIVNNDIDKENEKLTIAQNLDTTYKDIKKQVSEITQENLTDLALKDKEKEAISKILKQKENGHLSEVQANKKIQSYLTEQQKTNQNNIKSHQERVKQLTTERDILQEIQQSAAEAQRLDVERKGKKSDLNEGLDIGQQSAKVLEGVTKVTSSLSSMTIAWMSVSSMMDTINDKTATFGQKMSQVLMTLSFSVPMIISNFKKIGEVLGINSVITEAWNAKKAASNALSDYHNAQLQAENALEEKNNLIKTYHLGIKRQEIANQTIDNVVDKVNLENMTQEEVHELIITNLKKKRHKTDQGLIATIYAGIVAKKAETAVTAADTVVQEANNKAKEKAIGLKALLNPTTIVIAGLALLAGGIAAVVSINEKRIEQQNELAKQSIEEQNKIQDEINANTELYNSYMKTFDAYKKGEATKEDMKTVTDQLCEKYNLESASISALTGDYEKLTKEIINAQNAKAKAGLQSAQIEKGDSETILMNAFQKNSKNVIGGTQHFDVGYKIDKEDELALKALNKTGVDYKNSNHAFWIDYDTSSADDIVKTYDKLKNAQAEMMSSMTVEQRRESELFGSINTWLADMEESVEAYRTAIKDVQTYSTQLKALNIDFYDIDNLEEYREKRQELLKEMENDDNFKGKTDNELEAMADTFISQQNNSLSTYNTQNKQIEKMVERYGSKYEKEITDWIKTLPEEQLGILMSLDLNELDVQEVKTKIQELSALGERNTIQIQVDTITNIQEKITKGEEIAPEDRAKAENQLGDLVNWEEFDASTSLEQINLLGEALNELNQQRINNYNDLKKAEEENQKSEEKRQERIKELTSQLEEMKQTVPPGAEDNHPIIKSIKEELKELENLSYDIDLDLNLDDTALDVMADKVDSIVSKADLLKGASELIGKGFVVAAEDVEILSKQFPSLMQNADVLADGSVKLQKEIVNTILNGNATILKSNKNITDQQLEDQIILLEAEIESNNSKIKLMTDYLTGKIESNKLEEGLEQEQAKLESKLINALGEEEYKNTVQAAINNSELTNNVLGNLDEIGLRAQSVGEAIRAALAGEAVSYTPGGNAAVTTSLTAFQNQNIVEKTTRTGRNNNESAYIKEVERQRDELLKANEEKENLVASYKYQQSKLRSGVTDATKSMESAAAGTGGKIDDKDSGSSKDKKEEKKAEDEIDRYWEINKAIETVEEAISDLDKTQEKLFGREKIQSLKEENKLLEEQANRYRILAEEQRKEAGELQGVLSAYGVSFDSQGGVANYIEASTAALNDYNAAIAAYNSFSIDEATLEAAEKSYENFKSSLDRYESLYYDEMKDTQNKLDEIRRQELENNLEAWEIEIEVKLDTTELERQWKDFFKDIDENFKLVYKDISKTMSNLSEKAFTYSGADGDINTIGTAIKEVTQEIDKIKSGEGSDMFESISQAQEKLKELNDQLQDSASSMRDLWQESWEAYLEGVDQASDKLDDLMEQYDYINENIEYQRELIELLYGEEAYSLMSNYYQAQTANTNAQIDSLRQQSEMWKAQYEAALAIDEANGTLSEDTQKFYELWQEAQQNVNDKVVEYIQLLKDNYKNTINSILDDLDKKMTNGKGLEEAKTQWELLQKQAEGYYDDVEKVYQLSTLGNKYETSIANTTSLKNQQKLQDLYEQEMEYLREKKFLSEYDMDIANAKYEMTLKQIALEEAQQNKNAMKLTRGTDGNWSYQYVADEGDVMAKQQDLANSINNYYQISKDGYNGILEDMLSTKEEFSNKLREIAENDILNEEEKKAKIYELYDFYFNEESGILTNMYAAFKERETNLGDATLQSILGYYAIDLENYTLMTEEEQALIDGLKDGTLNNYDEMLTKAMEVCADTINGWSSAAAEIANKWYEDEDSVRNGILNSYNDMIIATSDYRASVNQLAQSVGQDFGEAGIKGALDGATAATLNLSDTTRILCEEAQNNLSNYRSAISTIESAWVGVQDQVKYSIELVRTYLKELGSAVSTSLPSFTRTSGNIGNYSGYGNYGGGGSAGNGPKGGTPPNEAPNDPSAVSWTRTNGAYYSIDEYGRYSLSDASIQNSNLPYSSYDPNKKKLQFNTGGYTGEWNNGDTDGRLAWLHQKELVLNSADTENILEAVDMVRDLSNLNESITQSIISNISKMILDMANLGNYNKNTFDTQTEVKEEKIFNINANFPNANDVESIKEAILSLPNLASQYIGRNKR